MAGWYIRTADETMPMAMIEDMLRVAEEEAVHECVRLSIIIIFSCCVGTERMDSYPPPYLLGLVCVPRRKDVCVLPLYLFVVCYTNSV